MGNQNSDDCTSSVKEKKKPSLLLTTFQTIKSPINATWRITGDDPKVAISTIAVIANIESTFTEFSEGNILYSRLTLNDGTNCCQVGGGIAAGSNYNLSLQITHGSAIENHTASCPISSFVDADRAVVYVSSPCFNASHVPVCRVGSVPLGGAVNNDTHGLCLYPTDLSSFLLEVSFDSGATFFIERIEPPPPSPYIVAPPLTIVPIIEGTLRISWNASLMPVAVRSLLGVWTPENGSRTLNEPILSPIVSDLMTHGSNEVTLVPQPGLRLHGVLLLSEPLTEKRMGWVSIPLLVFNIARGNLIGAAVSLLTQHLLCRWRYCGPMNMCFFQVHGPDSDAEPENLVDAACKRHDKCYDDNDIGAISCRLSSSSTTQQLCEACDDELARETEDALEFYHFHPDEFGFLDRMYAARVLWFFGPPPPRRYVSAGYGDPHFTTWDGCHFDFQV